MLKTHLRRRSFASLLGGVAALALLAFSSAHVSAQEAPAAPAAPAVVAPATPAPVAPETAPAVAPAARREETEVVTPAAVPAIASGTTPPPTGLSARFTAALNSLRGEGAGVAALADRDRTITDLRAQLGTSQQQHAADTAQIATLQAQLAQYQADHTALAATITQFERDRASVTDTVAALGFPASRLPAATTEVAAEKEMTHEQFQALTPSARMAFCKSGGKLTTLPATGQN